MRKLSGTIVCGILLLAGCAKAPPPPQAAALTPAPIPIKVVVVSMFEIGADAGDTPAEFQLWRERQKLDRQFPFAHHHDLFLNESTGVLGMVTGMGSINSATAVMALALDPRFDLSKAYWLVAGIAGVDPADASVGSAAWAEWLIDGDLAHEIDARETPKDWPTGYFARESKGPYKTPHPKPDGEVMRLNPALVEWAYQKTRDIVLPDDEGLLKSRKRYAGYPNAQKPPFVLKGDNMAAMTFWHGKLLNEWANRWTQYWTDGQGNFVTSAMEDTGTYQSLAYVTPTGKVDKERLLVLRTASNYTMQPPGLTAAQNLLSENEGYTGFGASVESAYRVGSVVVDELVAHWDQYRDKPPGSP
jgi:purine nucleoside permease